MDAQWVLPISIMIGNYLHSVRYLNVIGLRRLTPHKQLKKPQAISTNSNAQNVHIVNIRYSDIRSKGNNAIVVSDCYHGCI